MNISFLCNNLEHPVLPYIHRWISNSGEGHIIKVLDNISKVTGGDILFLISCSEKIIKKDRDKFRKTLVLHAGDLPTDRGWSPHVWNIVEGSKEITLTLLEAEDTIDSGKIWKKQKIEIPKHMLWNEINHELFNSEMELVTFAVDNIDKIIPEEQNATITPTYRRKRTIEDSLIDPDDSITQQFDLLRICDPNRFPAYFEYLGHRYSVKLEKISE